MKTVERQEDLRVRRTHKLLWEALRAELMEQTFEQITVKDICERAMVHRTTFYKHYEDKYALLEQGMRQMLDALQEEVEALSNKNPGNELAPLLVHIFDHVAQHHRFYRLILVGEGSGKFQKFFKDFIVEHNEAKMNTPAQGHREPDVPPAIFAQFFAGAFMSTLTWWLENNMLYPPQKMADYFLVLHQPLPLSV